MQYRLFQYPLPADPELAELNAFLADHRIATINQQIVSTSGGAMLLFVVEVAASSSGGQGSRSGSKSRIDYLRYMDDIVVWSTGERLDEIREIARAELLKLRLEIKNGGEWNRCQRGLPFLGYVIYPDRVRLNKNGRRRLRRKLGALRRGRIHGKIDEAELQQRCTSLFAHAAHADDIAWRRAVLKCCGGAGEEWN